MNIYLLIGLATLVLVLPPIIIISCLMYAVFTPPKDSSIGPCEDPTVKAWTGRVVHTKSPSGMGDPVRRVPQKASHYSANWSADKSPGLDGWEQPIVSKEPISVRNPQPL